MAVFRQRGPVPRVRGTRFGGSAAGGSKFSGFVSLNTTGLEQLAEAFGREFTEPLLKEIGDEVIEVSQPLVPVQTGELKASSFVEVETSGGVTKVDYGYTANHAAPVEFGAGGFTGPRQPKPFLRPAHDEVVGSGKAQAKIEDRIRGEIERRTK